MNELDFTNDYRNSSWLSKITYFWTNRLIAHSKKNKKIDDKANLIAMSKDWDTEVLSNSIDKRIHDEINKNSEFKAKDKIGRIVAKTFTKEILFMVSTTVFADSLAILNAFLISFFIAWLKDENAENWPGYLYALLFSSITIVASYARNLYMFFSSAFGVAVRKGISGVLYRKILRFNQKSKAIATSGKLVAIVSGELQLIERGMLSVNSIISAPIQLVFTCILLSFSFKEAVLLGFLVGLIVIFIMYVGSGFIKKFKYNEGFHSDKRLKVISDIINGIRTIKAYAWEIPFYKLVNKHRSKMVANTRKHEMTESLMWGFSIGGGYLMALAIFGYHYAMDRKFNYEDSVAAIGVLGISSFLIFGQIFMAINVIKIFFAVLKRVGEVLDMEELDSNGFKDQITGMPEDTRIHLNNTSFTWGFSVKKDKNTAKSKIDDNSRDINLKNIDFSANSSDLVAVVGEVGSGKSTFLSAVMKELELLDGSIKVNGKIAYVEQEPFIISGTLKQNILFGDKFDQDKFNKVVEVC